MVNVEDDYESDDPLGNIKPSDADYENSYGDKVDETIGLIGNLLVNQRVIIPQTDSRMLRIEAFLSLSYAFWEIISRMLRIEAFLVSFALAKSHLWFWCVRLSVRLSSG